MVSQGVIRISRHEQYFGMRTLHFDFVTQFFAAHLGHDDVSNDEIEIGITPEDR